MTEDEKVRQRQGELELAVYFAQEFIKEIGMERALLAQPDLSAPLPDLDVPAGMRTAWQSIRRLRAFASRDLGETDPLPYRVAQLRYAAHTLGFDEPDEMQKRAAAISVLLLCDWLASR